MSEWKGELKLKYSNRTVSYDDIAKYGNTLMEQSHISRSADQNTLIKQR